VSAPPPRQVIRTLFLLLNGLLTHGLLNRRPRALPCPAPLHRIGEPLAALVCHAAAFTGSGDRRGFNRRIPNWPPSREIFRCGAGKYSNGNAEPGRKRGHGDVGSWWGVDLGAGAPGSQNNTRYAYFPQARRLAVGIDGHVTIYDTGDHAIGGDSQQQSGNSSLISVSMAWSG
jgi:hypothetical protein